MFDVILKTALITIGAGVAGTGILKIFYCFSEVFEESYQKEAITKKNIKKCLLGAFMIGFGCIFLQLISAISTLTPEELKNIAVASAKGLFKSVGYILVVYGSYDFLMRLTSEYEEFGKGKDMLLISAGIISLLIPMLFR